MLRAGEPDIIDTCGSPGPARHIAAARAAMQEALRSDLLDGPVVGSSASLRDYLFAALAHAPLEELRALLLDSGNRLIRDAAIATGSAAETPVLPREIFRQCFDTGATAVILVHNHPSGDPTPSAADIAATRRFAALGRELGVVLHDHVIVARGGLVSMREQGLI